MNKSLVTYVSENSPNGVRDFGTIEDEMILTDCYSCYSNYNNDRNDKVLAGLFKRCTELKGRMPDLETLGELAWEHNSDLLHEMAIGYALEEYNLNCIDIEREVTDKELTENIDSWYSSCLQMYAENNALDEDYEIHLYAIKNGISYLIPKDSDAHDRAVCAFGINSQKDIIINHAQCVMFDDLINEEGSVFNYGEYELHYMERG